MNSLIAHRVHRFIRSRWRQCGIQGRKMRSGPSIQNRQFSRHLSPAPRFFTSQSTENSTEISIPQRLGDVLHLVTRKLENIDSVTEPRLEASILVGIALNQPREEVILNSKRLISKEDQEKVIKALEMRLEEMPMALISGSKNFFGYDFLVTSDTLIPRPATETLVLQTIDAIKCAIDDYSGPLIDNSPTINLLELGVGTGCVIITLVKELEKYSKESAKAFNIKAIGVDVNPKTLKVAKQNAAMLGVSEDRLEFYQSNWTEELTKQHKPGKKYDVIVSNPPYLTDSDWESAPKGMTEYEPPIAFLGGPDGLDCYRLIYQQIQNILNPGAFVCLEIGAWQSEGVQTIFNQNGMFNFVGLTNDMDGHNRVLVFKLRENLEQL